MSNYVSKNPDRVRSMFDGIADRYDFLNRLLSFGLDRWWRMSALSEASGSRLIDLACGSGDVMIDADEDRDYVLGLDLSREMLRQAESKLSRDPKNTSLFQGDALKLPVAGAQFDAATCSFGVRNFADRNQAFHEIHRVLGSEGTLVILEFFPPSSGWMSVPISFYLQSVLPRIGRFFSNSEYAYEYLARSIDQFVRAEELCGELLDAGFRRCRQRSVFLGLVKLVIAEKGD